MLFGILIGLLGGCLLNGIINYIILSRYTKLLNLIDIKYHRIIAILQDWQKNLKKDF